MGLNQLALDSHSRLFNVRFLLVAGLAREFFPISIVRPPPLSTHPTPTPTPKTNPSVFPPEAHLPLERL